MVRARPQGGGWRATRSPAGLRPLGRKRPSELLGPGPHSAAGPSQEARPPRPRCPGPRDRNKKAQLPSPQPQVPDRTARPPCAPATPPLNVWLRPPCAGASASGTCSSCDPPQASGPTSGSVPPVGLPGPADGQPPPRRCPVSATRPALPEGSARVLRTQWRRKARLLPRRAPPCYGDRRGVDGCGVRCPTTLDRAAAPPGRTGPRLSEPALSQGKMGPR